MKSQRPARGDDPQLRDALNYAVVGVTVIAWLVAVAAGAPVVNATVASVFVVVCALFWIWVFDRLFGARG